MKEQALLRVKSPTKVSLRMSRLKPEKKGIPRCQTPASQSSMVAFQLWVWNRLIKVGE